MFTDGIQKAEKSFTLLKIIKSQTCIFTTFYKFISELRSQNQLKLVHPRKTDVCNEKWDVSSSYLRPVQLDTLRNMTRELIGSGQEWGEGNSIEPTGWGGGG